MLHQSSSPRIIVAMDFASIEPARALIQRLNPQLCRLKVGNILFTHYGPALIEEWQKQGFDIFLDLKFHDIPNQISDACTAAAELGVWMINIHISGGTEMMKAARRAINQFPAETRPLLIGVTVLTSLDENDLNALGIHDSVENTVLKMAKQAKECGLDGVVCSALEAKTLRSELGQDFLLITPGIRLEDANQDQKRVVTPVQAFAAGADYLVMGRAITGALDPIKTLQSL